MCGCQDRWIRRSRLPSRATARAGSTTASAKLMPRERTSPVCDGLRAIGCYGVLEQTLTAVRKNGRHATPPGCWPRSATAAAASHPLTRLPRRRCPLHPTIREEPRRPGFRRAPTISARLLPKLRARRWCRSLIPDRRANATTAANRICRMAWEGSPRPLLSLFRQSVDTSSQEAPQLV